MLNAHFEKVTYSQFQDDCLKLGYNIPRTKLIQLYDDIQLPRRAEPGSAGYDFYMPLDETPVMPGQPVTFPTGIRVILEPSQFLLCVPRSGLGFKYGMRLVNTCGIIDSSYAFSDNEGHIMAKIDCDNPFMLGHGDRFMQGIIIPYNITADDNPIKDKRNGGFGSTGGANV